MTRFGSQLRLLGDGPVAAFVTPDRRAVVLQDLEKNRVVWRHPCPSCRDHSVSDDGSVFALVGADGLEVWDTRSDRRLFQETRRIRPSAAICSLSRDGRRVAWTFVDGILVRELDSGREIALPLDGVARYVRFSPGSDRLLIVTDQSSTLRESATGRTLWNHPGDAPAIIEARWSPERRAILLQHSFIATEVLDADTGERLAWFEGLSRIVTPVAAEIYAPDLRVKAVATATHWERRPVPQPAEETPAQSLARTLQRTGLAFRGVELVAAP